MKIAIAAAEIAPWAKAGGLADVIGALPQAYRKLGAEPILILPGYRAIISQLAAKVVAENQHVQFSYGKEFFTLRLAEGHDGIPIYLVDHPGFFDRAGIYGEGNKDYPDNLLRYIFFGRAAAAVAAQFAVPDILHAHDWHAATAAIVMRADPSFLAAFKKTLSVFTIHNLAFQGIFDQADYPLLGINSSYFTSDGLEFYGRVNLMKGAIEMSDAVSTVSPNYAAEVTAGGEMGFGLEGVLRNKGSHFRGILNGADYREWSPATDPHIAVKYDRQHPEGKRECARDLRRLAKLPEDDSLPLVGMVSRMTAQKGFDLLRDAFERVTGLGLQIVMLAYGEREFEEFFRDAQGRHPDQLCVFDQFDDPLAHKVQAGCDAFLMPSRFEPCGLTQMYALKYGSAPIVRATGGLRDTVTEFDPATGTGNGFSFEPYRSEDLADALGRMVTLFRQADQWRKLMWNCFAADFSWERSAGAYLDWFEQLRRERGLSS